MSALAKLLLPRLPRLLVAAPVVLAWAIATSWLLQGSAGALWLDAVEQLYHEAARWDCNERIARTAKRIDRFAPNDIRTRLDRRNCGM